MAKLGYEDSLTANMTGAGEATTQLKDIVKTLPLRVLSEADSHHWTTRGYVIVKDAVPPENLHRLVNLLWEFQELDPNEPASWFKPQLRDNEMKELNNSGMVEIYNHQYLWDNRQAPRVYDAFVNIWDREDLWVKIDRANLNPPNRGIRQFSGFIHCDVNTSLVPLPVNVQGVLSLVNSDPEMGGFQCVPELFRTLEDWIETQPADRDPWAPDPTGFEVVERLARGGRPADLQQPAAPRHPPQSVRRPRPHRGIHHHAPGGGGERGVPRMAEPLVAATASRPRATRSRAIRATGSRRDTRAPT